MGQKLFETSGETCVIETAEQTALLALLVAPWQAMQQLADLEQTAGRHDLAAGLRWLARHEKMPYQRRPFAGSPGWRWDTSDPWRGLSEGHRSCLLPVIVADRQTIAESVLLAGQTMGVFLSENPECDACHGVGFCHSFFGPARCTICRATGFLRGGARTQSQPDSDPYE